MNNNQTMLYCIEVDRRGICEENLTIHEEFTNEPSREDILQMLHEDDLGYDDKYCSFTFYRVS